MEELISLHKLEFGEEPEVIASAPGTFNLMGEHTDYNEGYVLQAALNRRVQVALSRRKDNSLRFYASDLNERKRTSIANLKFKREDRWANYPKGVLYELMQLGFSFKGFNLTIKSEVPAGIGLGFSAALCVATARALQEFFALDVTELQIVQSATLAENAFLGLHTEMTDQLVAASGKPGKALLLDMQDHSYNYIPINLGSATLLFTNSHVPLPDISKDLEKRRKSCKDCAKIMAEHKGRSRAITLRSFSSRDFKNNIDTMPEALRRLCLHVVEENERVSEVIQYYESGDVAAIGKLMYRSQESLRDNYEVSCPEVDWLIKRSLEINGVYGSRLTGPGFGGGTVTLIERDAISQYTERIAEYERIFGFTPETFILEPSGGATAKRI